MAELSEGKIFRTSLESLIINVSNDELAYRLKYLPDPRRLSDEKIVCTVCSISLASRVRKGKDIYVHAILGVLVCKHCCNFYGDGIFSTDEDGDDKYCRWCGQGGTLYLCSKCNCGFCKKCMTKNMKNSALKEIERDDWKCLICVPRPIFGSRAVCWASRELNSSARKTNVMKKRLEEEKLLLADKENYDEDNREFTKSAKNRESKAKKRAYNSEDSDSSTVFIPTKKRKEDKKNDKSLNGGIKKHRRKHGKSSSDNESSDDQCNSKSGKTKRKNEGKSQSQSSEDSSSNFSKKRTKKKLRKKTNSSSNESSDSDENVPKSKSLTKKTNKSFKTKRNVSKEKKDSKAYSSSSDSMKEQKSKKKKLKSSRENLKIDSSSEENQRKSDSEENNSEEKSKKDTSSEQNLKNSYCMEKEDILDISVVKESNCSEEADNVSSIKKVNGQEEKVESVTCVKQKNTEGQLAKVISSEKENPPLEKSRPENSEEAPSTETPTCIVEKSLPNLEEQSISEETQSAQQIVSDNEWHLSYKESSTESNEKLNLSQEDEVNLKVELAIEWLGDVANDIADLGNLITERTTKFGKKKVNLENLQSYEDVLLTLGKLKQLIKGIHTNYNQIEDGLEDKLKSWKILAGLDKSNFEEQSYDEEEGQIETESKSIDTAKLSDDIKTEVTGDTEVDKNELLNENSVDPHFQPIQDENEICSEVSSVNFSREDKVISKLPEIANTCNESDTLNNESEDIISKGVEGSSIKATELEHVESNSILPQGDESILEGNNIQTELSIKQELEITDVDVAIVDSQLSLKSSSSKYIWPGLWSSESDSDQNEETELTFKSSGDNDRLKEPEINVIEEKKSSSETNVLDDKKDLDSCDINMSLVKEESIKVDDKDAENLEALQELLETSESEPETESSDSDSDDSDDLQLDDSDLDDIPKPKKVVVKKSSKNKETKRKDEIENTSAKNKGEIDEEEKDSDEEKTKEIEKKPQEPLDSEAEIDMLTDLSKLKKKSVPKIVEQRNSDESSSEDSYEDDSNEEPSKKKKRKKYNTEVKKKREQERNELFGFLHGGSSEEDEVDISKNDLDVMEDQYVSESSDSMTLEAFSRKMNKKWRELENEQDQLNLQRLLQSSDSEEGPAGDDNLEFDVSDEDEKKKKKKGEKVKDGKINEDEGCVDTDAGDDKIKEEEDVTEEAKDKEESDQGYEQFLEDMVKNRTKFTGLGSSSEGEIDIKEEPVSDRDSKVKKELKDSGEGESSDSNSSADLFLDLTKKRSAKKPTWRHHKLLRMKLSDTDTSDEERLWQRRLEREKKKKERGDSDGSEFDEFAKALSPKKSFGREKNRKEENGSDKENKKVKKEKHKEDDEANSSSTLEMSSTESSGSEIFQKKKKKKKESSDSDVAIISDVDKKKKKKKKKLGLFDLSGDSSDESEEDDDDVIDITQKSSQGESPGKGGRKNIRKVLTKHELAAATKAAAKEEEERKKRIAARQKLFNEMFEIKEAEILEKLVLDFDPETKTELISVDKDLVTKMKPHQAKGVKFMWDSCFESLSQLKTKKGSGCILAHCMGLGKTFQVVSLVHTILTNKDTSVRTVLVVCPLSTVLNWYNEFDKWLEDVSGGRNINIYHLTKFKKAHERSRQLSLWHRTGGVMILGYEMFRILANASSKKFRLMHMEVFQKTLIDPGADLVVCDEGHMLKNESTVLSKAMSRIRTLRRIVLTGTPMQNNLKEYHCMVQFVKPNLLGTRKEFLNQFVNPITNGQFVDSTEADVKVMKRRAHVLHKMLEGLVQRFDYSVLTPFLPPKHEYVISLRLSDIQVKLYQFYLDHFCQRNGDKRLSSQLFQDWQVLGRIWTHPRVLKMGTDKAEKEKQETSSDTEEGGKKLRSQKTINDFFKKKKRSSSSNSSKQESEDEGSIKNFINEKSSSSSLSLSSTNSSSSDDDDNGKGEKKDKKEKKKNKKLKKNEKENKVKSPVSNPVKVQSPEVITVEPIEINLISSEEEEEDGDKREASKEVKEQNDSNKENEDKTNDSGIEDQEGKTGDEPDTETITVEEETNNKDDKEKENPQNTEINEKEKGGKCESEPLERRGAWWKDIIEPQHLEDINQSAKLVVLFAILRECELIEDKVLVFSQSLFSLDLIEYFLEKVDKATEENRLDESLGNQAGCWQKGLDYFRLDGSSSSESRSQWCKSFNREDNPRARLFLISTRAGGLGINLTGANRVVIFDASWNPSHDIQSIFRIYRFGQKKPCYVYRFVAHGTMEEKVYDRQVAKQSLSSRVVDEQQVHRHFSMNDLNELYRFTPPQERTEKPTPVLPKDRLMAELLTQYNDWIEKYHEHDSLLENIAEEELNEEERKLAWEDYENEKKQGFQPQAPGTGLPNFPGVANQAELFRRSLQLKRVAEIIPKISSDSSSDSSSDPFLSSSPPESQGDDSDTLCVAPMRVEEIIPKISSDSSSDPFLSSSPPESQADDSDTLCVAPMFPRATEVEMNAMLQTLMYQVNYRAVSQPVGAHQTGQRMNPGPSQQMNAGSSQSQDQNFRMRAQQSFNAQRNHLYQKYGTQAQSQPTQQQRVGNTQVNQSRIGNGQINPQRVGNGQIRRTNRTNQEHLEEMRRQQQANLARIQNQRRFQQQVQPQPARQRNNVMMNPQANNGVQRVMSNRLPQQQVPKIQPGMWNSNRLPPVNTNRVRQGQQGQNSQNNRKQTQVTPITNNVKPTTSNSQSHPLLKKALSPTTHIQKPTTSNPQTQSLLKKALSPKAQIQREQIKRRIEELKRRTSQPTTQQKIVKSGPADPVHQQQLEEMKKRYKASRRMRPVSAKSSEPISVVELDD